LGGRGGECRIKTTLELKEKEEKTKDIAKNKKEK
jgi:hypothetical protein